MPRSQGGKRQGTPGKGYANRTDLQAAPDMSQNTAATGGMEAPTPVSTGMSPEDTPMLSDPTNRPGQPVTAGLDYGPGPGSEALGLDPRAGETQRVAAKWGPVVGHLADLPDTPDSVRILAKYLRGF